ncbi:MAG: hypothetical protein ACRDD2_09865 [Sarcina sp.]
MKIRGIKFMKNKSYLKKQGEILIILLIVSIPLLHEFGHFLGYSISGVSATIKYGLTVSEKSTFLGVFGGPLFNILLSLISIVLVYLDRKYRNVWATIGLASSISRLLNCSIIFFIGVFLNPIILENNDEGQLALLMNNSIYIEYIVFLVIYFFLTLAIVKLINNNSLCKQLIYRIIGYNIIITVWLMHI